MINTLNSLLNNQVQLETAKWSTGDYSKYSTIRVEEISPNERQFNALLTNLFANSNSIGLKTTYKNDYQVGQFIQYRNRWYQIQDVIVFEREYAPLALAVGAGNYSFAFSLIEANQK